MCRVSDAGGKLEMKKIKSGKVSHNDFDKNVSELVIHCNCSELLSNQTNESKFSCHGYGVLQDVFILDCGTSCFVWVGSGASPSEKQNGMGYAHVSDVTLLY